MTISWAHSSPGVLRAHHAKEALANAGDPAAGVREEILPASGDFRGGLLFTPERPDPDAILVYFHGGGFVAGGPRTHAAATSWLAKFSKLRVLSARYRLAPEFRFPAQQRDAAAAAGAALDLMPARSPSTRLILGGDSAGALVALWALRALEPTVRERVDGLLLFYGGFGLTESRSIDDFGTQESGLDRATLEIMYRRLGDLSALRANPDFNPLHPDFEITPPAYLMAAELDAVRDDSIRLFDKLVAEDRRPVLAMVPNRDHGFLQRAGQESWVRDELAKAAAWATERLGGVRRSMVD